jgi:hypothetical protein
VVISVSFISFYSFFFLFLFCFINTYAVIGGEGRALGGGKDMCDVV